jgi:predicted cupin superfamily sugar epimerase
VASETAVHPRAADLIAALKLVPHPEGGYYGEVHRSGLRVQPLDDRPERPALTTIYFLLTAGQVSLWHRVRSDEVWHFYEGDRLLLSSADPGFERVTRAVLGPPGNGTVPVAVVPADCWQAARSTGAFTLVGCTVGPGFDFADFELLDPSSDLATTAVQQHAEVAEFLPR